MVRGGRRPKLTEDRIYVALRYGGKAPIEVTILQAAETWGVSPMEIENAPGAMRWLKLLPRYLKAKALALKEAKDTD